MSNQSEQLEALYQEVTERFENDRYVTVTPASGKASEQYEITYNVTGVVQKEDKSIQETRSHTVSITIPFGFPHFPPNCKPISPTFHPDFDNAAICIGDFWTRDCTLAELIIHIGRMVSGEFFSQENAFNEEALVWYKENSGRLPFEIVNFSSSTAPLFESIDLGFEEDVAVEQESFEVDILDDSDFESDLEADLTADFEFFGLEDSPQDAAGEEEPVTLDLDLFRVLIKQKRFHELDQILRSLPQDTDFSGKVGIEKQIANELQKAKKLQREGDEFEHKGNPQKALEFFKEVATTVSDYPNIQESIKRAQESLELLGDWTMDTPEKAKETSSHLDPGSDDDAGSVKKVTFFEPQKKSKLRILPIIVSVSVLALLAVFLYPMFTVQSQMKKATIALEECKTLLKRNKFTASEKRCESALEMVTGFQLFFKKSETTKLAKKITTILESPRLKQGLAGNVLYKGKYIHTSAYDSIVSYQNTLKEADTLSSESKWKEAMVNYKKALNLHPYVLNGDPADILKIQEKITLAEVSNYIQRGLDFNGVNDLTNATLNFKKALDAAQTLNAEKQRSIIQEIGPQLTHIQFLETSTQADRLFTGNQWKASIQHYKKALKLINNLEEIDDAALQKIKDKMARAELYSVIQAGKEAFSRGKWDTAIEHYDSAISLLQKNSNILSRVNSNESRRKLSRVLVQASILRDQQITAERLKTKNYLSAIEAMKAIENTITKSDFSRDKEFQTLLEETREAIADVKKKKLLVDLTDYLTSNYKTIFVKNFAIRSTEYLKDPAVTLERKIGEDFLFKVQCTEFGQGRPSILLMHYLYDVDSKNWRFYNSMN